MRYQLTDHEWTAIRPRLPNKPRGLPRVDDVVSSTESFGSWIRSAMARPPECLWPIHDLLQSLRSPAAGWCLGRIMDALAKGHDASMQMIDTSIVRVHQNGACIIQPKAVHGTVTWRSPQP